jgi:hypothetical protein
VCELPDRWLFDRQSASSRLFARRPFFRRARRARPHTRSCYARDRKRCSSTARLLRAFCRGVWVSSFPSISSLGLAAIFLFTRSPGRPRHIWSTAARLGTLYVSSSRRRLRPNYRSNLSCTPPNHLTNRWGQPLTAVHLPFVVKTCSLRFTRVDSHLPDAHPSGFPSMSHHFPRAPFSATVAHLRLVRS